MAVRSIDSAVKLDVAAEPDKVSSVSGRERKRLETHQRIFDAAMQEFREVGFQAAQVDRIVERAGVARGTFYFHFPTKEHVLLESATHQEAELIVRLRGMGPAPQSVPEYLKRVLICMLGGQESDKELGREIMAMYVRKPVDVRPSEQPLITEVLDYFIDAADRGVIRRDIAPEVLAIRFLGSFFHLVMGSANRNVEDSEVLDNIEVAIEIYFNGLSPRAD
jgi:AcrR family transcriptional regulator